MHAPVRHGRFQPPGQTPFADDSCGTLDRQGELAQDCADGGTGVSFDWNNAAEYAIAGALAELPEPAHLLSTLVYIFWPPTHEDVWGEIEAQAEQLIGQHLDKLVYQEVRDDLSGLKNASDDYTAAVSTGDPGVISQQWITTRTLYHYHLPHFQAQGYELLLLPLFAQYVNLYLALLRDGVLFGSQWGWKQTFVDLVAQQLRETIAGCVDYADHIYQQGYQNVLDRTPTNFHRCQPFLSTNAFARPMTLGVRNFAQQWPYLDPRAYPDPVRIPRGLEIYSDPVGTCDDSGAIHLPSGPTQPISEITVWAWERIDAVQLTYPTGGGPGGVTQTARMGDQGGGSNQPPWGGVLDVSAMPIIEAAGYAGDVLHAFTFTFADGTKSPQYGGNPPSGHPFVFGYDGHVLSSIHINGVSAFYQSADCAVFGFMYDQAPLRSLAALRARYVTAPLTQDPDQLPASLAPSSQSSDLVAAAAFRESWDAARQDYWGGMKRRAARLAR